MTEAQPQQLSDRQYLDAALAWLRLSMSRRLRPRSAWARFWSKRDTEMERLEVAFVAAQALSPTPALVHLAGALGLDAFEQKVLLLCVGTEIDQGIARLCAAMRGDGAGRPTFALAFGLFGTSWEALSPESPLRRFKLLEINQPGGTPITGAALRVDERIANFATGASYLDDRLMPLTQPVRFDPGLPLADGQEAAAREIVRSIRARIMSPFRWPVVQLAGTDAAGKWAVAARVSAGLGCGLYRMPCDVIPSQPAEIEALARLWEREQRLMNLSLLLDADEPDGDTAWAKIERFAAASLGRLFIAVREPRPSAALPAVIVPIARPTVAEQRSAWRSGLREGIRSIAASARRAAASAEGGGQAQAERLKTYARRLATSRHQIPALADAFSLPVSDIHQTVFDAMQHHVVSNDGLTLRDRLWATCKVRTRPRLDTLATRIEVRATKPQLVLPRPQLDTLDQIVSQVQRRWRVYEHWGFGPGMNRGQGISALFAGDSGTGKTMAAEVIAGELDLDLYRVDLAGVVSKYIGETEKNLRRLFDAAEDGGAILFFDEADALFGKRSEVKDSHDRYANIEINYLLQRMESYRGLAILATNRKAALDSAFLRRLRFVVDFPFPAVAERRKIWQAAFPKPPQALDWARLAKLNLSGGSIHNVALTAAFLADAAGETQITLPTVMAAARQEFRKLERPFNEADLTVTKEPAHGLKAVPA